MIATARSPVRQVVEGNIQFMPFINLESAGRMKKKQRKKQNLGAIFDAHVKHEFVDHDVDATMKTMVHEPYVHHVPILTGGEGGIGVRQFYSNHFINKMPDDAKLIKISRTTSKDHVIDEFILDFTHDRVIDFMLPGIPPTGKHVELPTVVVMKFRNGRIAHEHIYWDQASLLVQVGLLSSEKLPVAGVEQAKKLLELSRQYDSLDT